MPIRKSGSRKPILGPPSRVELAGPQPVWRPSLQDRTACARPSEVRRAGLCPYDTRLRRSAVTLAPSNPCHQESPRVAMCHRTVIKRGFGPHLLEQSVVLCAASVVRQV